MRRSTIHERYAPLIEALYDPSVRRQHIRTEMTFEDGRKGIVEGDVEIRDMTIYPGERTIREAAE